MKAVKRSRREKVLISISTFAQFSKRPLEILKNYSLVLNPYGRRMTTEEVISHGKECVGIIAGLEIIDRRVFQILDKLRCISRPGVGIDNIDINAAEKFGVVIRNTPEAPSTAVAELTIGLILMILRKIHLNNYNVRNGIWIRQHGELLETKTVGIIGVGNIGKKVAERLIGFGCSILTNDIKPDKEWLAKNGFKNFSKKALLENSDIVTLHASMQRRNENLINSKRFNQMKKGAIFINLSRGAMVDEQALIKKLKKNEIFAALDVFQKEPYQGPLTNIENVILTPHIGASTRETRIQMELEGAKNLIEELEKK